ncbi:UNVERIFIED_CONTAM: Cis-muuroladiene synthase [Sesamum latifolium]|uniref:Cis-muuroladiene synthase n=1 Tax=Sesamum latifolium TaxID=2727402 RepID=A0AAW2XZR2_9LAMI
MAPATTVFDERLPNLPKDVRAPITSYTPSMWADAFTSFSLDDKVQKKYAEAIQELKQQSQDKDQLDNYDLFATALQFRLLRQHHYSVSCNVFNKFKNDDSKFEETLTSDAKGLLSLYEAANVRIHGEDVLEDAVAFTTRHLNRMVQELEPVLQCQVKRALEQPVHRGVARLEARHYISFYERNESKNEILLKLAKLDFNYLQNIYKKELHDLSRWDINEIDRLPDYMKIIYKFILDLYEDYEVEAAKQGKLFALPYAKEATYAVVLGGQMPTYEEYLVNTVVTSCIYVFVTVGIPGLKSASKESIDWLMSEPNKALIASTRVCRHADDIGSDERESRGGNIPTAVDCYAKQYGVSKEETVDKFNELFENAWKDFNTEWSTEISTISKDMMEQLLNYARAAEVNYRNGRDAYANPQKIAGQIAAVFMDPIVI